MSPRASAAGLSQPGSRAAGQPGSRAALEATKPCKKTTIVSENLIMLTRPNLVLPNAYLVREDDGFTLIDTTTRGAAEKLIAAAARAGGRVRRVALTHGHGDHTGSLDALKEKLKEEVEVLIPELDARIHAGEQVVQGRCPEAGPRSPHGPTLLSKTATWSEASRSSRALGTALDTSPSSTQRSVVDRRRCVHINWQRSGHKSLLSPLPSGPDGNLGQGKGP